MEGLLLRYGISARIIPAESREAGLWAVPFILEEKRVPRVGANKIQEVTLNLTLLGPYLAKLSRAGFKALEIRLEVMVEPRLDQKVPIQILQGILPLKP
jgi:hypothetical protein